MEYRSRQRLVVRPGQDHDLDRRQAGSGWQGFLAQELAGRAVEARRRPDLGLVFVRPETQSRLLRLRQPRYVEPESASRRQQVVDDDFRARPRYRYGQVGLPDDAP